MANRARNNREAGRSFTPSRGRCPPDIPLHAAGVLDGETLYLRPEGDDRPLAPYAEDAAEDAAAVADAAGAWSPATTRSVSAGLMAAWLGVTGAALPWAFGTTDQVTAVLVALTSVAVAAGAVARRLGLTETATGMAFAVIALAASSGATVVGWAGLGPAAMTTAGGCAAVAAAALALWLAPPLRPAAAALGIAALFTTAWAEATALGLPVQRGAGICALLGVVAVGFMPRLAVEATGLGRIADQIATGGAVRRGDVKEVAQRARVSLMWMLTGVAAPFAAGLAVLATGSGVWPPASAATLSAVLWLRARIFSHVSHMLVLVLTGMTGMLAVAVALMSRAENPAVPVAAVLAATAVLGTCSIVRISDIIRIRLRMLLDRAELFAMLACGPLLLGVFNAYSWAAQIGGID